MTNNNHIGWPKEPLFGGLLGSSGEGHSEPHDLFKNPLLWLVGRDQFDSVRVSHGKLVMELHTIRRKSLLPLDGIGVARTARH